MDDDKPNDRLVAARCARLSPSGSGRAMSRQELADAVNAYLWDTYGIAQSIDATYVGHLEQGRYRWPNARRREAFRHVLGVARDSDIGLYVNRRTRTGHQSLPVRNYTESGLYTDRGSEARRMDPIGSVVDTRIPGAVPDVVTQLAAGAESDWNSFSVVTSMLAQQRQTVAPGALLSLVEAHRDCLLTLFRNAATDPVCADIGAMLGEASIVASRLWSAQGNRSMALAHCAYARNLADRLGNIRLGATARIFESNLHSGAATLIHADGDIMTGLRLLDEAATAADHLGRPARARIAAEQAQAYAALRMRNETEAALERARLAASGITEQDRIGLFSDWNTSRLHVYEGTCHLLLEMPAVAITHLEGATTDLDNDGGNTNVALAARVDLASAYALIGQLDRACTTLGDAYEHLRRIGNLRGISRARRAREGLNRWNTERVVRELDHRMSTV